MPIRRDEQTYDIIRAAMDVHKTLGHGFLEAVYQEALAFEFKHQEIPFQREAELPVYYKSDRLATYYKADFICFQEIIVELKALKALSGTEESQVINYLKAASPVGPISIPALTVRANGACPILSLPPGASSMVSGKRNQ